MKIDKKVAGILILILISAAILSVNFFNKPIMVESEASEMEVTVYNQNLGVVKEYRDVFLYQGQNDVFYRGVAANIDPTSVKLKSVNGNIDVLEQNYQYDLVNTEKILQKYVDKNITAYQVYGDRKEEIRGTLLSFSSFSGNQLILRDANGEIKILSSEDLVLPELPEGLITKPTLEWLIESSDAGNNTLELSYMTSGMTWRADYVVVTNANDTKLDLNGWVTVTNNAGTTF